MGDDIKKEGTNIASGNILISQGTQSALPIDTIGTVNYPISKIDVGNLGSSVPWQGSVTVTTGTQNVGTVNTGTVNTGTINTGTVDTISQLPPGQWGTTINITGTTAGTLKAAVSGSVIYITDLTISVPQPSNVVLYSGTAQVIAGTYYFAGNGGLVNNYRNPIYSASGSQILYQQSGTGLMSINAQGYVK